MICWTPSIHYSREARSLARPLEVRLRSHEKETCFLYLLGQYGTHLPSMSPNHCAEYAKTKMHVWCSPFFSFWWLMLSFQIDQCVLNQFISWCCPLQLLLLFLLLFSSWSANDVDCGQVGCDLWAINREQLEQHWLAQHVFTTPKYISVLSYIISRYGLVENTLWDKNRA